MWNKPLNRFGRALLALKPSDPKSFGSSLLALGLLGTSLALSCDEPTLLDDCEQTLTCDEDVRYELNDQCEWIDVATGAPWADGPQRSENGVWLLPNGQPTARQDFECGGVTAAPQDPQAPDASTGQSSVSPESGVVVERIDCTAGSCSEGLVCDVARGVCVACLEDTHCSGDRVCDPKRQQCVECREDAGCQDPSRPICNTGKGACTAACTQNSDCPSGQLCNEAEQACVACLSDTDCEGSSQCEPTSNTCVQCTSAAGCAGTGNPYCLPSTNTCVACASDADCDPNSAAPACAPELGQCVGCVSNVHCANSAAALCDAPTRTCRGCESDSDCPGSCRLSDRLCVSCLSDDECGAGQPPRCDTIENSPRTGRCVECTQSADCSDPSRPRCDIDPESASYASCAACRADEDCEGVRNASGAKQPRCASDGRCVACLNSATDCRSPQASACGSDGQCQACSQDGDCRHLFGLPACLPDAGRCVACLNDAHCSSPNRPRCDTATNRCEPCTADSQCEGRSNASSSLEVCSTAGSRSGQCVECAAGSSGACGEFVCDSAENRCTAFSVASALICAACVSDVQCAAGYACVSQSFQGALIGNVCLPTAGGGFCVNPFELAGSRATLDGSSEFICDLAQTTCPAFLDERERKSCADDAACGVANVDDAACIDSGEAGFLCATRCQLQFECRGFNRCIDRACQPPP